MTHDTITYTPARIGLRVDGGSSGLGHIYRQLRFARKLRDYLGWSPVFIATSQQICNFFAFPQEFTVRVVPPPQESLGKNEAAVCHEEQLPFILCDTPEVIDSVFVDNIQQRGVTVWLYGQSGAGCESANANLFTYPWIARELITNQTILSSKAEKDLCLVPDQCRLLRHRQRPSLEGALRVLVSMGGTDHTFLTGKVVEALATCSLDIQLECVCGAGFTHKAALEQLLAEVSFDWRIHSELDDIGPLASRCHVGITQMGNTAAELNCLGVPALLLNSTAFHQRVADLYCCRGGAVNLGLAPEISTESLARTLNTILRDTHKLTELGFKAWQTIDGNGVFRLMEQVFAATQQGFTLHFCDVCENHDATLLSLINKRPLVQCTSCGFEYMPVRPCADDLETIYGMEYFTHQRLSSPAESYMADKPNVLRFARARLDKLAKLQPQKGRLLDVGCALGFYLEEARNQGWKICGIDISQEAVAYAKQALNVKDIYCATVESAPFCAKSFDAIVASLVFEHFRDPARALEKMVSWLRPGGCIAIKVPHADGLMRRYMPQRWFSTHPDNHFCDYTLKTLGHMLNLNGVDVLEAQTEGIYLERLAHMLELDTEQCTVLQALPFMEEKWKVVAEKQMLGDSLVVYGRKR